ncbi:MAG: sigma-70 family RNA polymerase sigma factor, partial [Planctomycetota bacterium]
MSQRQPGDSFEPRHASWDSIEVFSQLKSGDSQAPELIYSRYAHRLILLARRRMTQRLAARVDPDDIVMSAYRSFFVRADGGQFAIDEAGGLWRLLVEITMHKLYRQARHHRAQRRSYENESHAIAEPSAPVASPEAAAIAAEEVEWVMQQLAPTARKSLELRLRGLTLQEIAAQLDINEKTVRRHLEKARASLASRMQLTDSREVPGALSGKPASRRSKVVARDGLRFDDYSLLEQIGQGSTGKVYRARCLSTGDIVAIKYLRKKLQNDQRFLDRMEREAETVQSIVHSGICRIDGWGVTPGNGRFLVMEYLTGGDLQTQLTNGPIPEAVAVGLCTQVAQA